MNIAIKPYTPRTGSAPDRVLHFFAENPDEELYPNDVAIKFGVQRTSVAALLRAAVKARLLKLEAGRGLHTLYRAGPALRTHGAGHG